MSDTLGKENRAAPTATLEQQILDPNHPKSDREWWAAAEITTLRAEVSELNSMFDARWSADMRAVECWRKVHPGNDLVLPDHVNLCLWLMQERTCLTARVEELEGVLKPFADESLWSGAHHEFVTVKRSDCDRAIAVLSASQPAPHWRESDA